LLTSNAENKLLSVLKSNLSLKSGTDITSNIEELFNDIDDDKNKSITVEELLNFFRIKSINTEMTVSAKRLFSEMDEDQNNQITLEEFKNTIMTDKSPKHLLYTELNNVLTPYIQSQKIDYGDLVDLLKQLTTKTSKNAVIIKNAKDTLGDIIDEFPHLSTDQKSYLDKLTDMTNDEVENEMDFLTVASSYCNHLKDRAAYLATDNEDCILKDYLKVKTNEFEEESKTKKFKGKA